MTPKQRDALFVLGGRPAAVWAATYAAVIARDFHSYWRDHDYDTALRNLDHEFAAGVADAAVKNMERYELLNE